MCPENGLKIRLAVYYELAFNATDLGVAGDARNLMLVKTLSILKSHRVRLVGRHEFSIAQPPETAVGVPLAGLGLPWSTQFGPTAPFNARWECAQTRCKKWMRHSCAEGVWRQRWCALALHTAPCGDTEADAPRQRLQGASARRGSHPEARERRRGRASPAECLGAPSAHGSQAQ